jgi:hypothetical protein
MSDTLRFGEVAIAAQDMIAILRTSAKRDSGAKPEVGAVPAAAGGAGAFVRCGCGTIKVRGEPCPACGE